MKKILLLLVGAVVAFAAHAENYSSYQAVLCGAFNGWSDSDSEKVTALDEYGQFQWKNVALKGEFQIRLYHDNTTEYRSGGSIAAGEDWHDFNNTGGNSSLSNYKEGTLYDVTYYHNSQKIQIKPVSEAKTYQLKGTFTDNWQLVNLPYEYTFDGTQGEQQYGLQSGSDYYSGATTFSGTKLTWTISENKGNDKITANYKGTVRFSVSGDVLTVEPVGADQPDPDPDPTNLDFYLLGLTDWAQDNAIKFETSDYVNYTLSLPNDIDAGKEVKINSGKWASDGGVELTGTFGSLGVPFNVGAGNGNIKLPALTAGTVFKLVYNKDGQSTLTIGTPTTPDPTPDPAKPTALYMHFKYDLEKGKSGANTQPYCHVYNTQTKEAKGTWASDAEKMSKIEATDEYPVNVTDKYSIWKFDLDEGDVDKYDAVIFYFPYGNEYMRYSSAQLFAGGSDTSYGDVTENDKENWAKYIYATYSKDVNGNKEFALQSYVTFEQFKERDMADIANGGRRNIYLIGWDGIQYFKEEGNNPTGNAINFPTGITDDLLTLENDHGCFYLPIKSTGNDARFKISWISPKDFAPASNPNDSRMWTTFDLGLIGVDKDFSANGWSPNYKASGDGGGTNGKLWFAKNKSVPYMNYNQADWVMAQNDFNGQDNFWLIVDTHNTDNSDFDCHTATIASFNPQPGITAYAGQASCLENELTDEEAMAMYDQPLSASDLNGVVYMKNVNKVSGTADITATDLATIGVAGFTRTYYIYMNDALVGQITEVEGQELKNITIDYMPLTNELNGVAVRAEYKDNETGLTFHSRTGEGNIESTTTLNAPNDITLEGRYLGERVDEESGKQVFGLYVTGLDVQYEDGGLNGYSDFEFSNCSGAELLHSESDIVKKVKNNPELVSVCSNWTPGDDWSSYLRLDATTNTAPVFLHDVVMSSYEDLVAGGQKEYTCTIYAVYPFIYNPSATLTIGGGQKAPAARANSYEGYKISNVRVPQTVTFTVGVNNAVSGVEAVEAEANDAPVEYYTISGIRVIGEPAPGLYIRRQGDKVSKVVVR